MYYIIVYIQYIHYIYYIYFMPVLISLFRLPIVDTAEIGWYIEFSSGKWPD